MAACIGTGQSCMADNLPKQLMAGCTVCGCSPQNDLMETREVSAASAHPEHNQYGKNVLTLHKELRKLLTLLSTTGMILSLRSIIKQ